MVQKVDNIPNQDKKKKRIIGALAKAEVPVSKGVLQIKTSILWKELVPLVEMLAKEGSIDVLATSNGNFYSLKI